MANEAGHGGYRRPSSPAAVSGPGAHARRTDGGPAKMDLPDAKYGEAKAFDEIQSSAPLGAPQGSAPSGSPAPVAMPTGLGMPSQNPNEPVTAGADAGAGPGMEALGLPQQEDEASDLARRYGDLLPYLIRKADSPRSSQEFRAQVRYLISRLP